MLEQRPIVDNHIIDNISCVNFGSGPAGKRHTRYICGKHRFAQKKRRRCGRMSLKLARGLAALVSGRFMYLGETPATRLNSRVSPGLAD